MKMKLTKETIEKYGTDEEKKILKEISSMYKGEIYSYLQSITDEILNVIREVENPYDDIFQILIEVYQRGETGR